MRKSKASKITPENTSTNVNPSNSQNMSSSMKNSSSMRASLSKHIAEIGSAKSRWLQSLLVIALLNLLALGWIYDKATRLPMPRLQMLKLEYPENSDRLRLIFHQEILSPKDFEQKENKRCAHPVGKLFVKKNGQFKSVEPKGTWQWSKKNELELLLDQPLEQGREFRFEIDSGFAPAHHHILTGDTNSEFTSSRLAVLSANLLENSHNNAVVQIRFNQKVKRKQLIRNLEVNSGYYKLSIHAPEGADAPKEKEDSKQHTFVIKGQLQSSLKLKINSQLSGSEGELGLAKSFSNSFRISKKFAATYSSCYGGSIDSRPSATIHFNKRLDRKQPLKGLKVVPQVSNLGFSFNYSGISIVGDFQPKQSYTVSIPKDLLSREGHLLGQDMSMSFTCPDYYSDLRFEVAGGQLSPHGDMQIPLKSLSIEKIRLKLDRVYANNLVSHLQGSSISKTARSLCDESISLRNLPPPSTSKRFQKCLVDLPALIKRSLRQSDKSKGPELAGQTPEDKIEAQQKQLSGIYALSAHSDSTWDHTHSLLRVSDIAMQVKRSQKGLHVWTNSLQSTSPLSNVVISVRSFHNQLLGQGQSDANGHCFIPFPHNAQSKTEEKAWVVLAQDDADLNYVQLHDHQIRLEDKSAVGKLRAHPQQYDCLAYAERSLYRPGEKLRFTSVLRELDGNLPAKLALSFVLRKPDGRIYAQSRVEANSMGQAVYEWEIQSNPNDANGRYELSVYLSSDEDASSTAFSNGNKSNVASKSAISPALGSYSFRIENFVPQRFELKAQADKSFYNPLQQPQVKLNARYYFGASAAGLAYKLTANGKVVSLASILGAEHPAKQHRFGLLQGDAVPLQRSLDGKLEEAKDSADGIANIRVPAFAGCKDLVRVNIEASVTEIGARTKSTQLSYLQDYSGKHIGLALRESRVAPVGKMFEASCLLLDSKGEALPAEDLLFELEKRTHEWVLQKNWRGRSHWSSVENKTIVHSFTSASNKAISLQVDQPGSYVLRAKSSDGGRVSELSFEATLSGPSKKDNSSSKQPNIVEITLHKKKFEAGEDVKLLVRSPFTGRILLCLESNKIHWSKSLELSSKSQEFNFTLPKEVRGGAFITASVTRAVNPMDESWLAHRALGCTLVYVDHSKNKLNLSIQAPDTAKPDSEIELQFQVKSLNDSPLQKLDSKQKASLQIWAVDESVLAMGDYQLPNPHSHFFAAKRLEVQSSDSFGSLFPDFKRPQSLLRIGGGDDSSDGGDSISAMAKRRSTQPIAQNKLNFITSRFVQVDASGRGKCKIKLPDWEGELRLMATIVHGDTYGQSANAIAVQSEFGVEANWPSFCAPGDEFEVPILLVNRSEKNKSGSLVIKDIGTLIERLDDTSLAYHLAPGEQSRLFVRLKAIAPGSLNTVIEAVSNVEFSKPKPNKIELSHASWQEQDLELLSGQDSFSPFIQLQVPQDSAPIPSSASTANSEKVAHVDGRHSNSWSIRPVASLLTRVVVKQLKADQPIEQLLSEDPFIAGTASTNIQISPALLAELRPALSQVLHYPYGCVEQSTSKLMGLLHATDLLTAHDFESLNKTLRPGQSMLSVAAVDPNDGSSQKLAIENFVQNSIQNGVDRLQSMQTKDGGLSYWPGGSQSMLWGTCYAALFLSELRNSIDESAGDSDASDSDATSKAPSNTFSKIQIDAGFIQSLMGYLAEQLSKCEDLNTKALMLRVLCVFNQDYPGHLARLLEKTDELDLAGSAHLAHCLHTMGRDQEALGLLHSDLLKAHVSLGTHGRLTSTCTQQAVALSVILKLKPEHDWVGGLVASVLKQNENGRYRSTLENAMVLKALSQFQMSHVQKDQSYTGELSLADGSKYDFDSSEALKFNLNQNPANWSVQLVGAGTAYLSMETEGLSSDPLPASHSGGLRLSRKWYRQNGHEIDLSQVVSLEVGELVDVVVKISCLNKSLGRIAIVDALAGGMQIENTALKGSSQRRFLSMHNLSTPNRMEKLLDRAVLFTSVSPKSRYYHYRLRVLASGEFALPPIQASCMYDSSIAARSEGGWIRARQP